MMQNYRIHFFFVLIFDAVSALTARQAFNTGKFSFTILAVVSLIFAGYFFMRLMEDEVGIIVNAIWIALGAINVTLASYFLFNEKLTWSQVAGMVVIIIGLILTQVYAPPHNVKSEKSNDKLPLIPEK